MVKKKKSTKQREVPEVYQVEVITRARVSFDSEWEYYVKWAGYDSDANSWEPESHVKDCQRLLESFWDHVTDDDDDHLPGYHVDAKEEWIQREKRLFARELEAQEDSHRGGNAPRKKLSTSSKGKGKARLLSGPSNDQSNQDDQPVPSFKIKLPPRRPRLPSSSDESVPLIKPPKKSAKHSTSTSIRTKKVEKNHSESQLRSRMESPTSLFSEPSSPEISLATLPPIQSAPALSTSTFPAPVPTGTPAALSEEPVPHRASSSTAPIQHGRHTNPRIKMLNLPKRNVAEGSALATKQRILLGAPALSSSKAKAPLPPTKSNLQALNFKKKNSLPADSKPENLHHINTSRVHPQSATSLGISSDSAAFIASPVSAHLNSMQDQIPQIGSHSSDQHGSTSLLSPVSHLPEEDMISQADRFLNSIMPPELAAPLMPSDEPNLGPIPPPPVVSRVKPTLQRIPKKWKWSGQMLIKVAENTTQPFCYGTLNDIIDIQSEGLRFNVVLTSAQSITFTKLWNIADVDLLFPAWKSVTQLARLSNPDEENTNTLRTLIEYMSRMNKIALAPLSLDEAVVGFLLVFPPTCLPLCFRFNVPQDLRKPDSLIAALVPWVLSPARRSYEWRKPPTVLAYEPPTIVADRRNSNLRNFYIFQHAIRVLKFPKWLFDYMSQANRSYCIWSDSGGNKRQSVLETEMLKSILRYCRANDAGLKRDVRAVFVHVGALRTLRKLPALMERRGKRPEITFYTFGTHESVLPERWGIHEIFPLGGIVTFTPRAIVDDPFGVFDLIKQIEKHQLWDCCISPTVIAMASRMTVIDADPLALFDSGQYLYASLLTMVEDGCVSLLQPPPLIHTRSHYDEAIDAWMNQQFDWMSLNSRGLLEKCLADFSKRYSNLSEREWRSTIEEEILEDMASIQMQPSIMDGYRRFVIIDDQYSKEGKQGFEWTTVSNFNFQNSPSSRSQSKS